MLLLALSVVMTNSYLFLLKLFLNTKWGNLTRQKKKILWFRDGVALTLLVYFTADFTFHPKLEVQYDGLKSKWKLSNWISCQSSKRESCVPPVKIQKRADRNVFLWKKTQHGRYECFFKQKLLLLKLDCSGDYHLISLMSLISWLQDFESHQSWQRSCIY